MATIAMSRGGTPSALQRLRRFRRTPKGLMTIVLLLLGAPATLAVGPRAAVPALLSAVVAAMLADLVLLRIADGVWRFPDGALLTGLFVALILDPHEPRFVPALTAALAIASKYLWSTRWSNIFNPAAVGLVAASLSFGSGERWWGALPDLPAPLILALLVAIAFIADRVNKVPMVLTFAGVYLALFTLVALVADPARVAEIFRVPDLNAALFFAGFMLTDPPTSPVRYRDQVSYGAIVAVAAVALYLASGVVWFLLGGLLAGNAWETVRRLLTRPRRAQAVAARVPGQRS